MDDLLQTVRDATAGDYEVFGELGREGPDSIWYLGRGVEDRRLVALRLQSTAHGPDGKPEYELEVERELNADVAVGLGNCHACQTPIRRWMRFCTQCGTDLGLGGQLPPSPADRLALLEEVRIAAASDYDVLGEMPWAGGGIVYFAVEKATQRLVRLRLKASDDGFELGVTRAMLPLSERISAAYVTEVPSEAFRTAPELAPAPAPAPLRPGPTVTVVGVELDAQVFVRIALGIMAVEAVIILYLLAR